MDGENGFLFISKTNMIKQKLFTILILLALTLSACGNAASTSPPAMTAIVEPTNPPTPNKLPQTEADVPRVTVEQARIALEAGAAILVDVRTAESFAEKHIAGALSIPLAQIEADPTSVRLDKSQWIITYCT